MELILHQAITLVCRMRGESERSVDCRTTDNCGRGGIVRSDLDLRFTGIEVCTIANKLSEGLPAASIVNSRHR